MQIQSAQDNTQFWQRFIYRVNRGEDRQVMTTERAASERLLKCLPSAGIKRFIWASAFHLGQGQSETYGRGRWLLAGDAAHAMGPSAGAGMMVGMLGAWRLGPWLARAARGAVDGETLRERYEGEQRVGSAAVQASNELIFRNMALSNPVLAAARAIVLRGIGHVGPMSRRLTATETLTTQAIPSVAN